METDNEGIRSLAEEEGVQIATLPILIAISRCAQVRRISRRGSILNEMNRCVMTIKKQLLHRNCRRIAHLKIPFKWPEAGRFNSFIRGGPVNRSEYLHGSDLSPLLSDQGGDVEDPALVARPLGSHDGRIHALDSATSGLIRGSFGGTLRCVCRKIEALRLHSA